MKNKMTKIADCIAPMKSMKFKQKEQFPWEDNELVNKSELRDKYFYESRRTSLPEDFEA